MTNILTDQSQLLCTKCFDYTDELIYQAPYTGPSDKQAIESQLNKIYKNRIDDVIRVTVFSEKQMVEWTILRYIG